MTYQPVRAVEVFAWGQRVGAIARNPQTGSYVFAYDPDWADNGPELSPIHLPNHPARTYEFTHLNADTYLGLPPVLADSLPDRFGNALVNAWMAEHGVAAVDVTPLDRLAYAADRTMGALTFHPPARDAHDIQPTALQMADLVFAARATIAGNLDGDDAAKDAITQLLLVGTSAGGNRAKAVVALNPTTYQIRSPYLPELPRGFEPWLVKLDGVADTGMDGHSTGLEPGAPYGLIEYAYHRMATAAGITMAECRILRESTRNHFMTRRFDRGADGTRHHILTLCGLAHLDFNQAGAHSYDQYLHTISELGLGPDATAEGFRRMVFNVMAVNRDDHTKNLAFLLPKDGDWQLAPAYDLSFAYNPSGNWTHSHQMSVNGARDHITIADLEAVGERNHAPAYRRIIRDVAAAVADWPTIAADVGVPQPDIDRVQDAITNQQLARSLHRCDGRTCDHSGFTARTNRPRDPM